MNKNTIAILAFALAATALHAEPSDQEPIEIINIDYVPLPEPIPPKPPLTRSTLWLYLAWMALYG